MTTYSTDIFTEPTEIDVHTLDNLGPLTRMAGIWKSSRSLDVPPKPAEAPVRQEFFEHTELQPLDPQTNGPQLLYGLRYHTHIVKPGEVETYHDQVGYWLWEPATGGLIQTVAIPRGQTVLAFGRADRGDTSFELLATRGTTTNGISSNPFLESAFKTAEYRIRVQINPDGTWAYDEDTTLVVRGRSEPFHHTDHAVLTKIGDPSSFSVFSPVKPQSLEETYYPITPSQRLRWFMTGTVGPAHLAGVAFVSACGTAVNRPGEYGPHWTGFADRLGTGVAGSAVGNAMEASGGLVLREDPRYFRVPQQPFRVRVGNVVRLTFLARSRDDGVKPAYARYVGVFGSNFLSNTWRVRSEANPQDALLRSSEGLAGRMAANAFGEFWPDLKKYFFHKRNQAAQQRLKNAE